jgi:hypothetical protein
MNRKILETIFAYADVFMCHICYTEHIEFAIVPCGHVLCGHCLMRLQQHRCPFCRDEIGFPLRLAFI